MSKFIKNSGQFDPAIAYVAKVDEGLANLYLGTGEVACWINLKGELEAFQYIDLWLEDDKPKNAVSWGEDEDGLPVWATMRNGDSLPKEGPATGGKEAIVFALASSYEICINSGSAGAAILNVLIKEA